jgi:Winged helix-turn helix
MLYVRTLTCAERGALRHLYQHGSFSLANRARIVLLSASGYSVPAITHMLECCRRTVRSWIHAFQRGGLELLAGRVMGRPPRLCPPACPPLCPPACPPLCPLSPLSAVTCCQSSSHLSLRALRTDQVGAGDPSHYARAAASARRIGLEQASLPGVCTALVSIPTLQAGPRQAEPLPQTRC